MAQVFIQLHLRNKRAVGQSTNCKTAKRAIMSMYDIDESELKTLKVLSFEGPSDEWIDFVMRNRQDETFVHDYDIVYGPVANDRVYVQFSLYEQGFISQATLLAELKVYKLVDQMLFHTEKALKLLQFIEAKEVRK